METQEMSGEAAEDVVLQQWKGHTYMRVLIRNSIYS